MYSAVLYGVGAQALTLLIILGLSSSCPIGQGCTLPSYAELVGKADRDLTYNITAEVHIDREHNVFRPNSAKTMLKNPPPNSGRVQANLNCAGYQPFNNSEVSDTYIQHALCPWKYECDFDPQRLPSTLFYAKCLHSTVTVDRQVFACKEIYYPVSTIRTDSCEPLRNSTQEWEMERVKNIPVACVATAV